jgi:hypothetical protein
MDETLLEIREYSGDGYKPLIDFGHSVRSHRLDGTS